MSALDQLQPPFDRWPFLPPELRTPAENQRWWAACYLPGPLESSLIAQANWIVLAGPAGSGKTTLLQAFRHSAGEGKLVLDYSPEGWPAGLLQADHNHLYHIQHTISQALRQHFTEGPADLEKLTATQREYLRWHTEKFNDRRAFARWLDSLPSEAAGKLRDIPLADLYPTQREVLDVQGQIEELINLIHRIGFTEIVLLLDANPGLSEAQLRRLSELFGWHELMHHPGLRLAAAIPQEIIGTLKLRESARGRVNFLRPLVSEGRTRQMIERGIGEATRGQHSSLDELATLPLQESIARLVKTDFEDWSPAGWTRAMEILCELAYQHQLPLDEPLAGEIRQRYYRRYFPLRLDEPRRGLWRGHHFIPLEVGPFEFVSALWLARGQAVDPEEPGRSRAYVHTLARRVRLALEPDPDQPIYLLSKRNEGYWLENCRFERQSQF